MTKRNSDKKKNKAKIKTFTIPISLFEIKDTIAVNTYNPSKQSKEKIINQAFTLHAQGKILEAKGYYEKFIKSGFSNPSVFSNYGIILKNLGKLKEAETYYRKAIELKTDFADAHYNLANLLSNLGNLKEAEISLLKAIELKPDFADAYFSLGNLLGDIGKLEKAELSLRKAIELKPGFADAYFSLGNLLEDIGKLEKAEISLRKAIELKPNFADAYLVLGNILTNLGNIKEAEIYYQKSIELNPNSADSHYNLGLILENLRNIKEAESHYRKAIKLKPNLANAHSSLGIILKDIGKFSDAYKYLLSASLCDPNNIFYFINANIRLSPIMEDNAQIDNERKQYKKEITNLKNKENMMYGDPKSFSSSIFYLAYQNRNDDRKILEDFSQALSKAKGMTLNGFSPDEYLVASSKRKNLKIGVCSMFLRASHSVGKCFINVLKDLSETDIDMTIYIIPEKRTNSSIKEINDSFRKVVYLPNCPQKAGEKILSEKLDLIFYPDIGMDSYSYILALSRLALVQVNSLGHGSTSGIKNIDYYITHGTESTKFDSSYTETLKRFRRLPFNFTAPKINEKNVTLKNVINSPNIFYIGLIQSLVKLHPTYDEILESILLNIENAYLVLITDKNNYKFKSIQDRWRKKKKLLIERSIILNRMGTDDFLHVTRSCDIMLDPFYFGAGVTFYEAMAFGIPFVTYPHNQKVSIVSAGYKQMKIKNPPIAKSPDDYINWCKLYSKDKVLLDSTKKELRQKAEKYLFNDHEIYNDYYEFFNESVKNSRRNI